MATRRANGEGSIQYNNERQRWEARFSKKDPASGVTYRRKFSGKTQREAVSKGKSWIQEIEDGMLPNAHKMTVTEWIDIWLEDYIRPNVRIKSYLKYKSSLRCNIKPHIGNLPLKNITTLAVQRLFTQLQQIGGVKKTGLSPISIRITRRYLCMAFDKARKIGLLTRNVIRDTDPPKQVRGTIYPLNEAEILRLLSAAKELNEMSYISILITVSTGIRLGELFGLKWDCVDLEQGAIYIKQTVATSVKGSPFQEPKTNKSRRKIPIPQDVAEAIAKYKRWQSGYILHRGCNYERLNLVIANSRGRPMSSRDFGYKLYKPALKKAGLSHSIRFHDLRHTHATLLLSKGIHPKIVQERLGHSTVVMTLDTYSHVLPDMQESAVTALENLFCESL